MRNGIMSAKSFFIEWLVRDGWGGANLSVRWVCDATIWRRDVLVRNWVDGQDSLFIVHEEIQNYASITFQV